MRLFTVGHSNVALEQFLAVLRRHHIATLVDVRSKPRSRFAHFDGPRLETALADAGVRYLYLGEDLGGMPRDAEIRRRWRPGHLDPRIVAHLRLTDAWSKGVAELARMVSADDGANVCVMCSERDPNACHRSAIALDVAGAVPGLEIANIAADKTQQRESGVQQLLL